MAEETIKGTNIKDIAEAAKLIKDIQTQIEGCTTELGNMSNGMSNVTEGILNITILAGGMYDTIKKLEDVFGRIGTARNNILNDKSIQNTGGAFDRIYEMVDNLKTKVKGAFEGIKDSTTKFMKSLSPLQIGIAAVVVVVTAIVAAFVKLISSNDELKEKITDAWKKISEAFEPAVEAFNRLKETLAEMTESEGFNEFLEKVVEGIVGFIEFLAEVVGSIAVLIAGVLDGITGFINTHGETIKNVINTIWEFLSGILDGAFTYISGIIDILVGIFTFNGDKIKEGIDKMWDGIKEMFGAGLEFIGIIFTAMWDKVCEIFGNVKSWFREKFEAAWEAIKDVFSGLGDFFGALWDKIKKVFTTIGTKVGNAIGGAFKGAINGVISFAQRTINGFIRNINSVIGLINKIPGVSIGKISTISIPKLASGGLVDAGQMFIARERGPELVGTFGSRTAVMNNSQIVDAVSKGVYAAVKSAMGGEGSFTFNIMNQLDGKAIGEQVIKYHNGIVRQTGSSPLYV